MPSPTRFAVAALLLAAALAGDALPVQGQAVEPSTTTPALLDPVERLEREVVELQQVVQTLRQELARAHLERIEAERVAAELRQFIEDHHELGQDFEQYGQVKQEREREARQRDLETRREAYEQRKTDREARRAVALAERAQRKAEAERLERYRDLGFSPLGLDVFNGRNAYSYPSMDTTVGRIDYAFGFGNYYRLYPSVGTDFSSMTISGSILNGADEIRNIGVAFTFFDAQGNQVGHETVQIANARPDVPYPFTSTIEMALDRPFASSSVYVLYADPAE